MITPAFELSQDPHFLVIIVRVPYTRTSQFDLYIDGEDFKFYAKPYFLRLTLPGRIVQDGREKATFDMDKGLFTLRVPKETAGEVFEGLDMLTSLLAPKGSRSAKPLVEEMEACGGTEKGSHNDQEHGDDDDDEEFDWQVEQQVYVESSQEELNALQKYGFGNQRCGVFARLQEELSDVIDVRNPDSTTAAERRQRRLTAEGHKFDPDHYLADLYEDDTIQQLLKFQPWWTNYKARQESLTGCFSEEEKEQLRKFSNRSYLLDRKSLQHVWLGLLDVVLAYVYDVRVTEGEHSVESAWNIRKLSGTLCWLETYSSVTEVLVSFGRRVLCYPLHRHFGLVTAAVQDVALIFQAGKACVLKCLLDVHKIFRENEPAYILNDLYISDYCVWIQKVKSVKVSALAETLLKSSLCKADVCLELMELEEAAALAQEEERVGRATANSTSSSSCEESEEEEEEEERKRVTPLIQELEEKLETELRI